MRLFPPELEIGDTEGFSPEKDIFGRAQLGHGLTNLVGTITEPMVIAVDGQWGSGKTTFLKMWAGELRKSGFPVIYFDAFERDYAEDAFLAIAGEIISLSRQMKKQKTAPAKRFAKSAVGAGKVLLRSGINLGIKGATLGVLNATDIEHMAEDISTEVGGLADKYISAILTEQAKNQDAIRSFKEALTELPALLSRSANARAQPGEETSKPLIFIIDELDRCRPSFALDILERIKHFFTVDSVHFMLGVHLGQLHNSVIVAYGPNIDAQTYLQKFIHLTFYLVEREDDRRGWTTTKFISYLHKAMEFPGGGGGDVEATLELVRNVAQRRNLSLRAIERIMTAIAIAFAYTPDNALRAPPILGGLCVLKVVDPQLFEKAKRGTLKFDDVRGPLALDVETEWYVNVWRFCTEEGFDGERADQIGQSFWRYNLNRDDIVPHIANRVIDRLASR